ncbi:hypothetical protein [Brevundimonas nasdae]|uniref:hypothetical protein n=1 Tax=Brevundimonas nasdae TaxID=172043 RepID=UPI003F68FB67
MLVSGTLTSGLADGGRVMILNLPLEDGTAVQWQLTPDTIPQIIAAMIGLAQRGAVERKETGRDLPDQIVIQPLQVLEVAVGQDNAGLALVMDFGGVLLPMRFSPAQLETVSKLADKIRKVSPQTM